MNTVANKDIVENQNQEPANPNKDNAKDGQLSAYQESQQLEAQLSLLAAAVHSAEDSIIITTTNIDYPGPEIVFVNKAFTKMTGYTAEEVLGRTPRLLQGPKTDRSVLNRMKRNLAEGTVFYGEAINYRKDGTEFYNQWHIEPIKNERGKITHYLAIQRDITAQKKAEEKLIYEAFHDELTGLNNRAWFLQELQKAIEKSHTSQDYLFAVMFIDLDGFKLINDSLGHQAGDKFLIEIAKKIKNAIFPGDILARLGGDEFTVIIDNLDDLSKVSQVADNIQNHLQMPISIDGREIRSSASLGVALSSTGYSEAAEMLRDADLAMYRAKELGKARYAIFNKTMHRLALERLEIENELIKALENNQLELYYQPIVSLETGKIRGVESLIRWHHPDKGMISPAKFIPVAEETGIIIDLGRWALMESCKKISSWQKWQKYLPDKEKLFISVNLSGKQFVEVNLIQQIEYILTETKCDPSFLKLEITESSLLSQPEMAISMLTELQELGIKIAIDDFGTGYSSLSRLCELPINTIKIDRSFISVINSDNRRGKIVESIIKMAHNLELDVIAEGIENIEQMKKLQELQSEMGQGYLFAKPLEAQSVENILIVNFSTR